MNRILAIAHIVGIEMLRQKALYVLLILMSALLFALASVDVFGMEGVVRHVQDIGMLTVWVLSWGTAVLVSARQLPRAEKTGAVFGLLAKPLSRGELLLGKWLGSWLLTVVAALVFTMVVVLVVIIHGGRFNGTTLLQAVFLHLVALAVICAVGMALSTALNEDAAMVTTLVLTVGSYFIMPRLPYILAEMPGWRAVPAYLLYYLAPHLEWFDMRRRLVHDWGPSPWWAFLSVTAYGALYTAAALLSGWLIYRRKRFNRNTA